MIVYEGSIVSTCAFGKTFSKTWNIFVFLVVPMAVRHCFVLHYVRLPADQVKMNTPVAQTTTIFDMRSVRLHRFVQR